MSEAEVGGDRELQRLRWRCRRGMRELDQMLGRWLERQWAHASETERGVFLVLLETEDDILWHWMMGTRQPDDVPLNALVQSIRLLPP